MNIMKFYLPEFDKPLHVESIRIHAPFRYPCYSVKKLMIFARTVVCTL